VRNRRASFQFAAEPRACDFSPGQAGVELQSSALSDREVTLTTKNFRNASIAVALCLAGVASSPASADVLQGQFDDILESDFYTVGSGVATLSFTWSASWPDGSGYFYTGGPSSVAVYVGPGLTDPTTVMNAASFAYQTMGWALAEEGDTVFLRGEGGVYAALALRDFVRLDPPVTSLGFDQVSKLDADWYVDTTGRGNFSVTSVPEPSAYALMIAGLALCAYRRRPGRRSD
jgi:hypothetical protein